MRVRCIFLALSLPLSLSCSGVSGLKSTSVASGAYEFVITSNVTGGVTLVETNLTASGSQSNASGPSQVQILTLEKKIWYVNGSCPGSNPGQNSVSASFAGKNVSVAFSEGGNTIPGNGVITGSSIAGNYSLTGSSCPDLQNLIGFPPGQDSGGFVGNVAPALSGTFAGPLNLPSGTDNAAFIISENSDSSVTVNAVLTGPVDNGSFTLTGSVVGNAIFVSGSISGTPITLLGYYDRAGTYTGLVNSLLVFNYGTLSKAGVLLGN